MKSRRLVLALLVATLAVLIPGTATAAPSPSARQTAAQSANPAAPVAASSCAESPPTQAQPPKQDGAGLFDLAGQVKDAINGWFSDLAAAALNPVLDLLGCTLLATPDLTAQPRVRELWGQVAIIANSIYVLLVLAGGVLVMSHGSLQTQYSVKEIAPRLVVGIIAGNTSLVLTGMAIEAANALSGAFTGMGVDPASVWVTLAKIAISPSGGVAWWIGGLVISILAIAVLVTYLVRLTVTVLLVVAAPLMLACHAHPLTDPVARLWWRAFGGVLAIQVTQALTLVVAVRVFFDPAGMNTVGLPTTGGLVDLALCACLLWILIRIPSWITRMVLRGGRSRSRVVALVKGVLIYKAIAAITGGAGAAAGAAARRRPPNPGGRRGPGGPRPSGPGSSGPTGPRGGGSGGPGPRGSGAGPRPSAAGGTSPPSSRGHVPAQRQPADPDSPPSPARTPPGQPTSPARPRPVPPLPRPRTPLPQRGEPDGIGGAR